MEQNSQSVKNKKNNFAWLIVIFIILGLTLPFHYVPAALKAFPKDHFTFKHTIITQRDIDDIIEKYNNSSFLEQTSINNDPFIRTLREQGIIVNNNQDEE